LVFGSLLRENADNKQIRFQRIAKDYFSGGERRSSGFAVRIRRRVLQSPRITASTESAALAKHRLNHRRTAPARNAALLPAAGATAESRPISALAGLSNGSA
jgi:hypothetical protein